MPSTLNHQPLDASFGVMIEADLRDPLSPDAQAEFRQLFNAHGLVVVRGQELSQNQQVRAMSYLKRGRFLERDPDVVSNVAMPGATTNQSFVGATALAFHSDSAFLPEPIGAISLLAKDVVADQTTTSFSNVRNVYRELPAELRRRIEGLHTVHVMPKVVSERNRARDLPAHYPRTARLLAHRHPVTGEPVVYVSWVMIDGIVELSEAEGDALLDELYTHVSHPQRLYEHRWRNGDLVIWDNVMCLHARKDMTDAGVRILQRASIGAYHFSDLYPEFPTFAMNYAYQDR